MKELEKNENIKLSCKGNMYVIRIKQYCKINNSKITKFINLLICMYKYSLR